MQLSDMREHFFQHISETEDMDAINARGEAFLKQPDCNVVHPG